jgi:hypothetical protein
MATLASALFAVIVKNLTTKLSKQLAEKFELDEEEVVAEIQEYLNSELGKAPKGKRGAGQKGKNGKGRTSGFILFSSDNREKVKKKLQKGLKKDEKPSFGNVGKELGKAWKELSLAEKEKWGKKALLANKENGFEQSTKKASPKKATSGKEVTLKATRNQDAKQWMIAGTKFVLKSSRDKRVIGKLVGTKVVKLSAAEVKKCNDNDWPLLEVAKGRKAKPVVDEVEEDEVEEEEDEVEEEEDEEEKEDEVEEEEDEKEDEEKEEDEEEEEEEE